MKCLITTLGFCLLISSVHAQDYMDDLTDKVCECVKLLPAEIPQEEFRRKFGLCLIESSSNYKKELKKNLKIDVDKLDKASGEKLGQQVGMRLPTRCPEAVEQVLRAITPAKESSKSITTPPTVQVPILGLVGTISRIEQDFFVIFSIKNENNVTTKFYWLTPVSSNVDLPGEYNKLLDKKVILEYKEELIFDPKIGDYRKINVITSLNQQ
jgi:hypothetical protein